MFDKFFVGGDVMSSVNNGKFKPISRVTLLLDDSNAITAGDDTGREIVANCPHATQTMVDALLDSLKGYEYQAYEAGNANIDPSAELGDGVTVGGMYSVIAKMRDDGSGYASLSAPGEAELEDEYPMDGPMTQMFNREIKKARSAITKTAEEIRLEVAAFVESVNGDVNNLQSSITQTAEDIRLEITNLTESVNGDISDLQSSITQTAKDIRLEISNLTESVDGSITDLQSSISQTATDIRLEVSQEINGYVDDEGNNVDGLKQTIAALELGLSGIDLKYQQKIEGYTDEKGNFVNGLQQTIAALELGADGFKVNVEGALGTDADGSLKKVSSSITAALGELKFSATSTAGKTTLELTGGGVSLKSDEFDLSVKSVNISGTLTTDQLHLDGVLTVYDGPYSDTAGGYIGYDNGFNGSWGIGIRTYAPDRYGNTQGPQFVCTDSAARMSYTTVAGRNTADTSVVCKANTLSLTGYKMIQMAIDGSVLVDLDEDGLYPAASYLTLGLAILPWADVYAAGTSMSELLARVEALEAK